MSNGINKEVAREAMSPDPSQLLEFFLIYYGWPDDQRSILALTSINNFSKIIDLGNLDLNQIQRNVDQIVKDLDTNNQKGKIYSSGV